MVVERAVGGDHAAAVVEIGLGVDEGGAVHVAHPAAGRGQDRLGATGIPQFRLLTRIEVEIAVALAHQHNLQAHTADIHFVGHAQGKTKGIDLGRAARFGHHDAHAGRLGQRGGFHGRPCFAGLIAPGALAHDTTPQRTGARARHDAQCGPALEAKADHHHVAGFAANEVARAVDWVDHPHAWPSQARVVVRQFFRQDCVVGEFLSQAADDERVGRQISLGDGLAAGLVLDRDRPLGEAAYKGGSFLGQPPRDIELVRKIDRPAHDDLAARSATSRRRPMSSTRPARGRSRPVRSTGMRSPMESETTPMRKGDKASPRR